MAKEVRLRTDVGKLPSALPAKQKLPALERLAAWGRQVGAAGVTNLEDATRLPPS